jgi:DNA-binding NtrC family response regulator
MIVLVVDDQRSARHVITRILRQLEGVEVLEASQVEEARQVLSERRVDLALVDVRLSEDTRNRDGLELVREIKETTEAVPIVVSAINELSEIRAAMRHGATDYILKDEICEELILPVVTSVRERRRLEQEVLTWRARQGADAFPVGLVGSSPAMERLRAAIRRVVTSERPVLVVGPTGSGKELVVRAIHALGAQPDAPLLDVNCGAIPEQLMESQLFGHERGAFTGADRRQEGYLSLVGGGTLFLDELAELPQNLQVKLLRVLETGRFRPIGSKSDCAFHGRVVAATHADLQARVREGRFREDLWYRLNVLLLRVPPLSERREDIPALVGHFVGQQKRPLRFSQDALEALSQSDWPGNVRELRNAVDRLAVFCEDDLVTAKEIATLVKAGTPSETQAHLLDLARALIKLPVPDKLDAIENALVEEAIALAQGNKAAAARLLGIHRKAMERRLDKNLAGS